MKTIFISVIITTSIIPLDAQRYESAKNTQAIGTHNERPRIQTVSRDQLERKWQVPGGLENVEGWKSELYRWVPKGSYEWRSFIPVKNGFGFYQNEIGYVREYAEGTQFYDVLKNEKTGKIFEIRLREKIADKTWAFRIPYRDEEQRPKGYNGVKNCITCHSQAGTGGYGVGLVPGGDGTISDPFWEIK